MSMKFDNPACRERSLPSDSDLLRRIQQKNRSSDIRMTQFMDQLGKEKKNRMNSISRDQKRVEKKLETLKEAKARALEQYLALRSIGDDCSACQTEIDRLRKTGVLSKAPSCRRSDWTLPDHKQAKQSPQKHQGTDDATDPYCFITKNCSPDLAVLQEQPPIEDHEVEQEIVEVDHLETESLVQYMSRRGSIVGPPRPTQPEHSCGSTTLKLPTIFKRKRAKSSDSESLTPRPATAGHRALSQSRPESCPISATSSKAAARQKLKVGWMLEDALSALAKESSASSETRATSASSQSTNKLSISTGKANQTFLGRSISNPAAEQTTNKTENLKQKLLTRRASMPAETLSFIQKALSPGFPPASLSLRIAPGSAVTSHTQDLVFAEEDDVFDEDSSVVPILKSRSSRSSRSAAYKRRQSVHFENEGMDSVQKNFKLSVLVAAN